MLIYHCDTFVLPLPEKHRFPMKKYELLRRAVTEELVPLGARLAIPPPATDEQILLVHDSEYFASLVEGRLDPRIERQIGFPFSQAMLERSRRSVGATLAACHAALESGVAANLAGGTHHAFQHRGEGFCVFNDSAVALRSLQREGLIKKALVIDTDVHQGNGTASIFGDDPSVFTFSIHGANNFPFRKEKSDLDIALPDGTEDEVFLEALQQALTTLNSVEADIVIFQSGADPYVADKLGRLSLSKGGLRTRDQMVLSWCRQRALPVAVTMGGGYAPSLSDIVEIHLETVRQAFALFQTKFRIESCREW